MARIWSKEFFVDSKKWAILILIAAFSFKLYLIIWQFVSNGYLVPPGGDPSAHLAKIGEILAGKPILLDYPPLYHYIMATIVRMTGSDALEAMKYSAIALLFLPIPFFYFLSKSLFGFWAAFWATLLFILVSSNPLLGFVDGNYPDLLNYGVFIPLVFLLLVKATYQKPILYSSIGLIFTALMIFTHHLTAILTLLIVAIYLIVLGIYLLIYKKKEELKNFKWVAFFYLVFFVASFLLIKFTFGAFLSSFTASLWSGGQVVLSDASKPVEYNNLATLLSPMLEFLGLVGIICLLVTIKRERTNGKIFMIIWIVVLWILSRTTLSAVAPRYLRELSVPLAIVSGFAIATFLEAVRSNYRKILICALFGYIIFINIVQLNTNPFLLPEGFDKMVWYRQIDQEKVEYLVAQLPPGAVVLANPSNPYLPHFLNKGGRGDMILIVPRTIPLIDENLSPKAKKKFVDDFIAGFGTSYIFIGTPPIDSPNEKSFGEFVGLKKVTDFLLQYQFAQDNVIKEFRDGSKLIKVGK